MRKTVIYNKSIERKPPGDNLQQYIYKQMSQVTYILMVFLIHDKQRGHVFSMFVIGISQVGTSTYQRLAAALFIKMLPSTSFQLTSELQTARHASVIGSR